MLAGVVNWLMVEPSSKSEHIWNWITIIGLIVFLLNISYYLFMLFTSLILYRPLKSVADDELVDCTVIIPAYNEGKGVFSTIESAINSDYPANKLNIVAIDDGSVDDTWFWIQKAEALYKGRVKAIRHDKNSGKRCALATGVYNSNSEIIITLDSDSHVKQNAFRALASHFLDSKVGSVAGNLRVTNIERLLPRMLDVCFVFNFDIMRSSQSVFDCVLCTPGALSAYRRSALLPFIDAWVHEEFMGSEAGIGEDRALATNLLKCNYKIKFERQAVAFTKVPETYVKLCRMFLRWCRGDIRETLKIYSFIFSGMSLQRLIILFNTLMQTAWIITPFFLVPSFIFIEGMSLMVLYLAILLWATIPAILYAKRTGWANAIWAYSYALFYIVFMFWLVPYSLISVHNSKWMTRELEEDSENGDKVIVNHNL